MNDASDELARYRAKRDFARTPEPQGASRGRPKRPMFVVQKHDARRLHYDVRLEVDNVLVSWAVPKGPSYDPKVRRMAVMTEDHPMDYADFEGIIPQGEYGGGVVIVWDQGSYVPVTKEGDEVPPAEVDAVMREAIRSGRVRVRFDGEKLQGSWTLVQSGRGDEGGPPWLLIKRRDATADAKRDVVQEDASVLSGRTLDDVVAEEGTPAEAARRLRRKRRTTTTARERS